MYLFTYYYHLFSLRDEQTAVKDLSSSKGAASGEDIILSTLHSILQKPSASQHPYGHTNNCSLANIPLQLHCSPCTYVLPSPSSPSFPLVTSTSAVPSSLYHSAPTYHLPPSAQLGKCSGHTALYNKNGIMNHAPWPLPTADETKDSIIKVTEEEPSESYNHHCCNTTHKRKLHMVEAKRWLFERTSGGRGGRRTSSRAETGAPSWLDDEECVKRKRISQIQLDILEAAYVDDPLPSRRTKQKLALQLGISHKKVQIWSVSSSALHFS